jgi:hypothetical protein
MRFILPILCAALLLPVTLQAQTPPVGYLGVYADEAATSWCVSGTAPYQIDLWIYLLIGENGAERYSFDIEYPSNVDVIDTDINDNSGPSECIPPFCPQGINGWFGMCLAWPMSSSVWLVHATLNVMDETPSIVRIVPNPDHGTIRLRDCDGAYEYPPVLTHLNVNYPSSATECGALPVENKTWGAIKNLYR